MKVKVHWNLAKAKAGIFEWSVTARCAGGKVMPEFTNNIKIINPKLVFVKSAYKRIVDSGMKSRKVYAQIHGDMVEFAPVAGRAISCNPKEHTSPNFYFTDTKQDLQFGESFSEASFTVVDGKPLCIIK